MLTENQQTVFDWINDDLELPVYAEAYKGALDLLNEKSPGYITFVSHVGRDIMNGLASDAKSITRSRVDYQKHVDKIKSVWNDEWGSEGLDVTEEDDEKTHPIPNEICKNIKELISEHKEGRLRAEEKVSLFYTIFLDYPNKESIPENLSKEWRQTKDFFEKHAHLRKKGFSMGTPDEVEKHFMYLDDLLYAAASSELDLLRSIHEILEEANE